MLKKIYSFLLVLGFGIWFSGQAGAAVATIAPDVNGDYHWDISVADGLDYFKRDHPFKLTGVLLSDSTMTISMDYAGENPGAVYFLINNRYTSEAVGPDTSMKWQWLVDVGDIGLKPGNGANTLKFFIDSSSGGGAPVPLPSAVLLLGCGLIGMVGLRRRSG